MEELGGFLEREEERKKKSVRNREINILINPQRLQNKEGRQHNNTLSEITITQ